MSIFPKLVNSEGVTIVLVFEKAAGFEDCSVLTTQNQGQGDNCFLHKYQI